MKKDNVVIVFASIIFLIAIYILFAPSADLNLYLSGRIGGTLGWSLGVFVILMILMAVIKKINKMMSMKHFVLLVIGVIATVIAKCFKIHDFSSQSPTYIFVSVLAPPVSYFVILSVVALIVAAIRNNIRKFWFPVLAWLFLISGLFDVIVGGYIEFVQKPEINRMAEELVKNGIVKVPHLDPRERILGHWSSEDSFTHQYYGEDNNLVVINLDQKKHATYNIEDFSTIESWIKYNMSGADYEPHTRTMYFLGDKTAWQIMETDFGKFKSKYKWIGPEQSP